MSDEPFAQQVGGTHYKGMAIQPQHFSMVNGWDSGAFSVLKYLSRHRSKKGAEDVQKAGHFVALRHADIQYALPPRDVISMQDYVKANGIYEVDHAALLHLEWWVQTGDDSQRRYLLECIEMLLSEYAEKTRSGLAVSKVST